MLLALDACTVAAPSWIMFRAGLSRRPPATYQMARTTSYFNRTPNGLEECQSERLHSSADIEAEIALEEPVTGLWAPTTRHFDSRLKALVYRGPPLTPGERQWLRDFLAARFFSHPVDYAARCAKFLRQPENSDCQTPILSGYIHNSVSITLLALFLWSLGWIPRLVDDRRRAALRDAGLCPFCRYDMTGLGSAPCPECGRRGA